MHNSSPGHSSKLLHDLVCYYILSTLIELAGQSGLPSRSKVSFFKDIRFYVEDTLVLVGLRIVYIVVILVMALIFCTGKHRLLSNDKERSGKVF